MMCLALTTLGTGIPHSTAQAQEGETDLIVIDGKINATEVKKADEASAGTARVESDGKLVEIHIGTDAGSGVGEVREQLIILNEDGKIRETRTVEKGPPATVRRMMGGMQVVDPETRAAVAKLIAALEDEAQKLQAEGRAAESEKKLQSILALRQVLESNYRGIISQKLHSRIDGSTPAAERQLEVTRARESLATQLSRLPEAERQDGLKRLAARRHELATEIAKVPEQDREQRAQLGAKIAEIDRLLAEEHKRMATPAEPPGANFYRSNGIRVAVDAAERDELNRLAQNVKALKEKLAQTPEANAAEREQLTAGIAKLEAALAIADKRAVEMAQRRVILTEKVPRPPQAPGFSPFAPLDSPRPLGVPVLEDVPHVGRLFRYLPQTPEILALTQKVQALKQAADALAQAGMEDQARELRNAAEKVQKELELRRAEMAARPDPGAPLALPVPPHELHRSIRELTEQVQQLRKEVAEVRELLQRRQ